MWNFEKTEKLIYKPQPDITAYELALILPLCMLKLPTENLAKRLSGIPVECLRHLKYSLDSIPLGDRS